MYALYAVCVCGGRLRLRASLLLANLQRGAQARPRWAPWPTVACDLENARAAFMQNVKGARQHAAAKTLILHFILCGLIVACVASILQLSKRHRRSAAPTVRVRRKLSCLWATWRQTKKC